jgi:hypothetical protein
LSLNQNFRSDHATRQQDILLHIWVIYTVLHINKQVLFGAENQGNHQIFEKSLLSYKFGLIFIEMKQKKKILKKKKIKMADSKKPHFPAPPILNIFS